MSVMGDVMGDVVGEGVKGRKIRLQTMQEG